MPADGPELRLFAYGTLKRGGAHHERYLGGARTVRPAWVHGRLHLWSEGVPILAVPPECVLATGTPDPSADLADDLAGDVASRRSAVTPDDPGRWRRIQGELVVATDGPARLRALDALEGFHPSAPGHFIRVLLRAHLLDGSAEPAWAYIAPDVGAEERPELDRDRW